jgi:hypothetical protein
VPAAQLTILPGVPDSRRKQRRISTCAMIISPHPLTSHVGSKQLAPSANSSIEARRCHAWKPGRELLLRPLAG